MRVHRLAMLCFVPHKKHVCIVAELILVAYRQLCPKFFELFDRARYYLLPQGFGFNAGE